jgi:hypothetical protein
MKRQKALALWVCLAIFLTALWSASGTLDSVDASVRARVANQLVTEGRLVVEKTENEDGSFYRDRAGTYSSRFGLGQSIYFLPFMAVAHVITDPLPLASEVIRGRLQGFFFSVPVFWSVLALNFWLCLKLSARLGANRFTGYLVAFVATFGSSFWQMAKQAQEEVQLSLLLLTAVLGYVNWIRQDKRIHVWISGLAGGLGLIFRPTAITIFSGILGIYAFEAIFGQRKEKMKELVVPITLTASATVISVLTYNYFKTGNLFNPGYNLDGWFSQNWLTGIIEPIIGLDRGLFMTNLWLLPTSFLTLVTWRTLRQELKVLTLLCVYLIFSSVLIYTRCCWPGDMTYGARYQVHCVPLLCVVTCMASLHQIRLWASSQKALIQPVALLTSLGLFLLQIPSISLIHHLELQQAMIAKLPFKNRSFTSTVGQVRLRYANFFQKMISGQPVELQYPNITPESQQTLSDASRWNFWPWLAEKRLPLRITQLLKIGWGVILVASLVSWGLAFSLLSKHF